MPDCSPVNVTAYLDTEQYTEAEAEAICKEFSELDDPETTNWAWTPDEFYVIGPDDKFGDEGWFQVIWSEDECPRGTSTPDDVGFFAELRKRGIPYEAADGGHYTWTPTHEVWGPGYPHVVELVCGAEGNVLFTSVQAIELGGDEGRIERLVTGDPRIITATDIGSAA